MLCETHKGIILAGGKGTRLGPITTAVSKQLLPVYDKPMIFYPLSTLIRMGIEDILIITNPEYIESYKTLLGDGQRWGIRIAYCRQESPKGLPDAYILAKDFLEDFNSVMVLGDNIFYGEHFDKISSQEIQARPCAVFGYPVDNPSRYGVAEWQYMNPEDYELPATGWKFVRKITEKPNQPKTKYAVPGLYFMDKQAPFIAAQLHPSSRGEIEIADLINEYALNDMAHIYLLHHTNFWFDCGTPESLLDAAQFVATTQARLGRVIGHPKQASYEYNR